MSQSSIKSQRRYIRKLQRESYEATIRELAAGDARYQALQSFMKPKPKYLPAFAWRWCQSKILNLPDAKVADTT